MDEMERKVKHLEFIQSNIARMNQCAFQMKGWAITIVSALLALFASSIDKETGKGETMYILVAIFPVFIFWILDSYYLQQENKFRRIYDDIIANLNKNTIKEFEMPISNYNKSNCSLIGTLFSKTECGLYLTTIIGLAIIRVLL